jgi:hypothetical protein
MDTRLVQLLLQVLLLPQHDSIKQPAAALGMTTVFLS